MKFFLALFAMIFAASAIPTDFGDEIDPSRQPGAFTTNANYSSARVPWGQAGYASMNGGTHGGNGGAVWTVWDAWALRDAVTGNDRRVIYVRGRIDFTPLFTGSPGVRFDVGNYKSIVGGDSNAMIFGGGLNVRNVRQVIVENLKFHNALSYAPGEQPNGNGGIISQVPGAWSTIDNLGIENAEHVWVHHCEFADDPWIAHNTPGDRRRHDGLIDITRGANWISISNTLFRNHNLVSLNGNSENNAAQDRGRLKVTWYHNWFQNTVQRHPLIRYGEVHVVNNLYTDITSYAIGIGIEAKVFSERNVFVNTRRAWGFAIENLPVGQPAPASAHAYYMNVENRLVNSQHDCCISANGVTWRPYHYYPFASQNVADVEAYVRRYAGTR